MGEPGEVDASQRHLDAPGAAVGFPGEIVLIPAAIARLVAQNAIDALAARAIRATGLEGLGVGPGSGEVAVEEVGRPGSQVDARRIITIHMAIFRGPAALGNGGMTNEHSDLGAAGMGLILAADERFDGQQIGPVLRKGFGIITTAIEVLRVGVHVARHPVLDDFPAVGDQVGPVSGQAGGEGFGKGLIHQQEGPASVGWGWGVMRHAEFQRWPAIAQHSVTIGLPRSCGRVGEDRGSGVAIDDFPDGGIGTPGPPPDRIKAALIAVAFPVAWEGQSDARG